MRSLLALLLENDPLVSKNRLEPYLLLIYTGARKFPDSAFFRSFGILNFRVLCLNELDAEKEIVKLRKKVDKDPGFKTRSVWSLFLLLFLPLAKGFDRKRLSDCAALALKILDNPFREEYFKAMKSLYGPYLGDIDQADRTTEENLIMKSTAVPMPPELENINVVSRTNEMWELELEYKKELEEAEEYVKAAKKAAEKAEKKAKKAKKKAKKAAEKNSKEIASKLISEGLSLEKIAEFTGLTLEQVRSLA
ncbi:MAG: hypothetical protein LBR53_01035, partial [Deltaproteobacteria bacterium]|nr:hypothetical protein [Deltaproteobacteria bacterium]